MDAGTGLSVSSENSFNKAFSDIAHVYFRDRCPKLAPYEVGFQVVDASEDMSQALGIIGCKIGDVWVMCPVFFDNGRIEGRELMWVKNNDQFLPTSDGWVSYLVGRNPLRLGDIIDQDLYNAGVRQPDFVRMKTPPYKTAAWKQRFSGWSTWAADAWTKLAKVLVRVPDYPYGFARFLKTCRGPHLRLLLKEATARPVILAAIRHFYPDALNDAIDRVVVQSVRSRSVIKQAAADTEPPRFLVVRIDDPPERRALLTEKERAELIRYGLVARPLTEDAGKGRFTVISQDDGNTSIRFRPKEAPCQHQLQEVNTPGLYEITTKTNKKLIAWVIPEPVAYRDGRRYVFVVLPDGRYDRLPSRSVQAVRRVYDKEVIQPFFDKITIKYDQLKPGDTFFVDANRKVWGPFTVTESLVDGVSVLCSCPESALIARPEDSGEREHKYTQIKTVLWDAQAGGRTQVRENVLHLPADAKVVVVEPSGLSTTDKSRERSQIQFGEIGPPPLVTPAVLPEKTASVRSLTVSGDVVTLDQRPLELRTALIELMQRHNLSRRSAVRLLKQAAVSGKLLQVGFTEDTLRVRRVKTAMYSTSPHISPGPPGLPMTDSVQSIGPNTIRRPVGPTYRSDFRDVYDPRPKPDRRLWQLANQAAMHGDKEIFDTSMLAAMLDSLRGTEIAEEFIPDFMTAIDRLGRLLFLMYWHKEDFEQRLGRYGRTALLEHVRNAFELLGDIALKLIQEPVLIDDSGSETTGVMTSVDVEYRA